MFSDVSQWIKEYFVHLNDNFDENTSGNDTKYQYCRYMDCVIFDFVLMSGVWMIYFVYRLINYLKFQPKTKFYHLMQIIIVLIVCAKTLYYYNYQIKFYSNKDYFSCIYINYSILNKLFDIFMVLTKFCMNCIVPLQNDCGISIIHVGLMIHNIMEVVTSTLRCVNDTHAQKNHEIIKTISHVRICVVR